MSAQLLHILAAGAIDLSGNPLSFGKVKSFEGGTTTLSTLFKDEALTDPHTNPLILDAAGKAIAYSNKRVKLQIFDENDTLLQTVDFIDNRKGNLETQDIEDDAITMDKINEDVAGAGLNQNANGALDVDVDDVTTEINNNDKLQVKDEGIDNAKLADDAVTNAKMADNSVNTNEILDDAVTSPKIAPGDLQISGSSDAFSTASVTPVDINGNALNVTLNVTKNNARYAFFLVPDGTNVNAYVGPGGADEGILRLMEGANDLRYLEFKGVGGTDHKHGPCLIGVVTGIGIGMPNYRLQASTANVASLMRVNHVRLVAYELR